MLSVYTATAAAIGGAMSFGMALALLGLLKSAASRNRWPWKTKLQAINLILPLSMLLGGILVDLYGMRALLVAGSALLAVALVSLSLRPSYPHAVVSLPLAVFAASVVGMASIVLMPRVFFSPEETTASLNLGYVFLALGSLPTPFLADILLVKLQPRRTLAVFAFLALLPAFLAVLPGGDAWPSSDRSGAASSLFGGTGLWLAALAMFFYAPLEASMGLWTFALLADRQQDEKAATKLLPIFWAGLVSSRLVVAIAQHGDFLTQGWDRALIVIPPLMAAAFLGNLPGATSSARTHAGMALLGFALGPILPTLLAVLFQSVSVGEQGTACGLVFAGGSLGSALVAPLLVPRGLTALRIPILLALLVAAAALVMGLITA
jgi:hypothetical protein